MSGLEKFIEKKRLEWVMCPKSDPSLIGIPFEDWLCIQLFRAEETIRFAKKAYNPSQETMDAVNKFVSKVIEMEMQTIPNSATDPETIEQ